MESFFLRLYEYRNKSGHERPADEEVVAGDTYKWLWYGYDDNSVEYGQILELNHENFFKFSFGKAGICTVRIKVEAGEHIVELTQEEIPTDENGKQNYHVGCKNGWTFYLANLKSVMGGGLDLRNKNEQLQRMLNS